MDAREVVVDSILSFRQLLLYSCASCEINKELLFQFIMHVFKLPMECKSRVNHN